MWVRSLGWENLLEEGMATHSSILAKRIPWTRSLVGHKEWCMTEATYQAHTREQQNLKQI